MTKTKKGIVREVAKATGLTQRETMTVVEEFLRAVSKTLASNDRIELRGFGVFSTKLRKPKVARNPKTGEVINLPERIVPVFKPSKFLRKTG
jgi:nucleoid DNA-binding protein